MKEQKELETSQAVVYAFAECGDLVNQHLQKYRRSWTKHFGNSSLPELVKNWKFAGGPSDRTTDYSQKLMEVIRNKHPELVEDSETNESYEIVASWIYYYAARCEMFHCDMEGKLKSPNELLRLFNDVLMKFEEGQYTFTSREFEKNVPLAVKELRDKHFHKEGSQRISNWTDEPVHEYTETEAGIIPRITVANRSGC
jgi:hypothetical protein